LGVIESQRSGGGTTRIPFRHLLHGDENIVVRVATLLTNRRHAGHRFAAAAKVSSLARQIHPRLITFRCNDGLIHGAIPIIDGSYLVLGASGIALRSQIPRRLAERTLDNAFVWYQHSLDDDLGIRRNQKILTESFRWC